MNVSFKHAVQSNILLDFSQEKEFVILRVASNVKNQDFFCCCGTTKW